MWSKTGQGHQVFHGFVRRKRFLHRADRLALSAPFGIGHVVRKGIRRTGVLERREAGASLQERGRFFGGPADAALNQTLKLRVGPGSLVVTPRSIKDAA